MAWVKRSVQALNNAHVKNITAITLLTLLGATQRGIVAMSGYTAMRNDTNSSTTWIRTAGRLCENARPHARHSMSSIQVRRSQGKQTRPRP